MTAPDHGPGVRIPPPVMVAGLLAVAWLMRQAVPVPLGPPLPDVGALVIFAALMLIGWALLVMVRAGNDPRPDRPDAAMVETGPFRFSRNPIYLGDGFLLGGVSLLLETAWPLVFAPLIWALLRYGVIRQEEAHLEAKFGDAYRAYRARVRRWL